VDGPVHVGAATEQVAHLVQHAFGFVQVDPWGDVSGPIGADSGRFLARDST
jgi:hypothetical protein